MITAKVVEDSISSWGKRIISFQTHAPKFIDAQFEKHRILSSGSSSSRAVPFKEYRKREPFIPQDVRANQSGMQGSEASPNTRAFRVAVKVLYVITGLILAPFANSVHKQHINRYLDPWMYQDKIVTGTEWDNFFNLRLASDAQPEIHELAQRMKEAMDASTPKILRTGQWHLPYITQEERESHSIFGLRDISAARCARVSYLNHDKSAPDVGRDLRLATRLWGDKHFTPFEHQATPLLVPQSLPTSSMGGIDLGVTHRDREGYHWSANFKGWGQYRKVVEMDCA